MEKIKLQCDNCGKSLGTYLYGKGGVEEKAFIGCTRKVGLPDIECFECASVKNIKLNVMKKDIY